MKIRNIKIIIGISISMFYLAGCSNQIGTKLANKNSMAQVLEEQMNNEDSKGNKNQLDNDKVLEIEQEEAMAPIALPKNEEVDYDLTEMGADMVYATVYGMMVEPDTYVGKRIKMRGQYYASYYEPTGKYYHYVIVSDAAACCAQGIEFVWDDGTHLYPDDYPPDQTEVEVVGIFETYRDEGNEDSLYCRLKNASFKVLK